MDIRRNLPSVPVVREFFEMNAATTRAEYRAKRRALRDLYHEVWNAQSHGYNECRCWSSIEWVLGLYRSPRNAAIVKHLTIARYRRTMARDHGRSGRSGDIALHRVAINCVRALRTLPL